MAAPAVVALPTAASKAANTPLENGFSTRIAMGNAPGVALWEVSVTPPSLEGGDPIDGTDMYSERWMRKCVPALIEMGLLTATAKYSPQFLSVANTVINDPTNITVWFPDGSSWTFWGWLKSFTPGELVEGEKPTATVEYVISNNDPTTGTEEDPIYTAP